MKTRRPPANLIIAWRKEKSYLKKVERPLGQEGRNTMNSKERKRDGQRTEERKKRGFLDHFITK
jgi:hypothetical protein